MELRFDAGSREAQTHTNLSALRRDRTGVWVAGDETATVEHLMWTGERFDGQRTFHLADYVELPAGPDMEADIEGLAVRDGYLWAVGSHSLKRRRAKSANPAKAAKRLATVLREENRFVLVRLPLDPVTNSPQKGAIMSGPENVAEQLADDPHLAPFTKLPGKDNGLDVEGIAVHDGQVYLGLRGPVLRGWAVVLEMELHVSGGGTRMRPSRPYRKHFLDLDGLGVRDLCPYQGDLLLLTGPSMDLDGPVRVVRWRVGEDRDLVPAERLETVLELPYGHREDHPEGLAVLEDGRLMVVYDSPSPRRITPEGGVLADVYEPAALRHDNT
ncbi:DUF3616 domain-containing protein [Nonomuraea sp. NPDC050536]|uniref:DUF3616 domain-containing protein n=1 Tax=Nonomuraea sp. NPDC050536 TaxID=3364366 RepID=UPI0037CBA27D